MADSNKVLFISTNGSGSRLEVEAPTNQSIGDFIRSQGIDPAGMTIRHSCNGGAAQTVSGQGLNQPVGQGATISAAPKNVQGASEESTDAPAETAPEASSGEAATA